MAWPVAVVPRLAGRGGVVAAGRSEAPAAERGVSGGFAQDSKQDSPQDHGGDRPSSVLPQVFRPGILEASGHVADLVPTGPRVTKPTAEMAFEAQVVRILQEGGWQSSDAGGWDVDKALFPSDVCSFLEATQLAKWTAMRKLHGDKLDALVVDSLVKELQIKGTLHVLRHGFKFRGRVLRMAHFKPAHGLNDQVLALYSKNRLTVARQVRCHPGKSHTVDLLFALNGLPVATCELKNPGTGQTWDDAVKQYKTNRWPQAPLFRFKQRALVHFAADTEQVHMTTRLAKGETRFLPCNRGSDPGGVACGAGNPEHVSGYRTGYFWEDVLARDSFLDVLGHFMFVEANETMIFPRYHQLDAVRRLVEAARADGPGRNYLVQHSAGSGKTNSISWLSHRLASLHDAADRKVFDCVIVVTDRRVLDSQLQDAIYQIEHAQGVVKRIDRDSKQLAEALVDGTQIVVTTLQKFPFVLRGLLRVAGADSTATATAAERDKADDWAAQIAGRRYAVVVDEAHSSQSGETARQLKAVLGKGADVGLDDDAEVASADSASGDWQDGLNAVLASRGRQPNLSFFAFTATPKGKTLELFGRPGAARGTPEAFHLYSMKQAIEEGFILDVLTHYTTYKTYWRLLKRASEDPDVPKRRAARALAKFMALHPHNISQKTEVIVEHFRANVAGRLDRRGKAMVVTSSRLHAVRYVRAFRDYVAEKGYENVRPLVAFSGTVRDPDTDEEFTEPGMNLDATGEQISEKALPGRFASPEFNVLLVANKYQTGFDQPLLCAMYVDKRLDGVQAVQTLSRLNRTHPGKEPPFVLDFVNDADGILDAFMPYYGKTELEAASDPSRLEALKVELDKPQVYHWSEVEQLCQVYFASLRKPESNAHARLQCLLQPAVDRFAALSDDEVRSEFRDKLAAYLRLYEFVSQIVPYADSEWEKLHAYGSLLRPLLADGRDPMLALDDDVALQYYRLRRTHSGRLQVEEDEPAYVVGPSDVGTGRPEEPKAPLSEIIALLNDRHGSELGEADRFFFEEVRAEACADAEVLSLARANDLQKFALGVRQRVGELMVARIGKNDRIVTRYMDDDDFQATAFPLIAKAIWEAANEEVRNVGG